MALIVGTTVSDANGFRNPPEGAAAFGRAGGKIAHIDDPSAVVHNPANLADLETLRGQGGITIIHADIEYKGPGGRRSETRDKTKIIPSFFAAVPLGDSGDIILGVGVASPFGQSTVWPKDATFLGANAYFAEIITINVNPTLATRVSDSLLIGAGVDVMYSELDFRQQLGLLGPLGPLTGVRLQGDGSGLGFHAGATLDIAEGQRLAVTYKSSIEVDYEGDTDVSGFTGPLAPSSDFDSTIDFPSVVAFGYGITIGENLRVGVDIEWIEFSTFDALPLDLGVNNAAGIFPPAIPQAWDDSWTYGVGADLKLNDEWMLRGGWTYLETPIPEATVSPSLPDADRHFFALGLGFQGERHGLDFAYAISVYDREVDSDLAPLAFVGDYDTVSQLVQVTHRMVF
jgi:long-chain fatty acid transport protein